jgi:FG-GAP-like repeat
LQDGDGDSLADPVYSVLFSSPGVSSSTLSDSSVLVGSTAGKAYRTPLNGIGTDSLRISPAGNDSVTGVSLFPGKYILTGNSGTIAVRSANGSGQSLQVGSRIAGPATTAALTAGAPVIIFATADGNVYATDSLLTPLAGFPVHTGVAITEPPALGDVNGDGSRDIIVFGGNTIVALNRSGAMLDNFPVTLIGHQLSSSPILADLNNDGLVDVIGGTSDGLVVAYDFHGTSIPGFPLQAGTGDLSLAVASSAGSSGIVTILAAASTADGAVSAWQIGRPASAETVVAWSQYQHDGRHTGIDLRPLSGLPATTEFFPPARAYNWPNPVYSGNTFLRYYVRDNAAVSISIFDLAGDIVAKLSGTGIGGIDNEIAWNTDGIQSGVYFARIEATGRNESGIAVVKVAVVR